jgi:hypothetical protein
LLTLSFTFALALPFTLTRRRLLRRSLPLAILAFLPRLFAFTLPVARFGSGFLRSRLAFAFLTGLLSFAGLLSGARF